MISAGAPFRLMRDWVKLTDDYFEVKGRDGSVRVPEVAWMKV